jgi:tRNA1(Val) A37 N6-methylase TrmN6
VLRQPTAGHRAGLDAVMLAAAAPVLPDHRVLDAGCGTGVVGLCIAARVAGCHVTGIDNDAELIELARANAQSNNLSDRYRVVLADLTGPFARVKATGLSRESFDVVVANPPFYAQGRGTASATPARNQAGIMPPDGLEHWIRFMTSMAAPGGRLVMVHLAEALPGLLDLMDGRFGAICVYPLYPREGDAAHRVIVSGRKGSRAGLTLKQGLILHGQDNAFTAQAEAVLRYGEAIVLKPRRDDP